MRVSFFATCLGDQFFADAAADAVRLLRFLDVDVDFPGGQTCCGQPAFNAGHWREARRMAEHTIRVFEESEFVVLPSGSCAGMVKNRYPGLFPSDDPGGEAASGLAGRTFELAQFIVQVLGVTTLGQGLEGRRVAYHHGCHALRELGVRDEPIVLLESSGAEIVTWETADECCGFGGLFSVKLPEVSVAMADRKLETLPSADVLTSSDPGCLLQLAGRMKIRGPRTPVRPLASVLWEAARGNP